MLSEKVELIFLALIGHGLAAIDHKIMHFTEIKSHSSARLSQRMHFTRERFKFYLFNLTPRSGRVFTNTKNKHLPLHSGENLIESITAARSLTHILSTISAQQVLWASYNNSPTAAWLWAWKMQISTHSEREIHTSRLRVNHDSAFVKNQQKGELSSWHLLRLEIESRERPAARNIGPWLCARPLHYYVWAALSRVCLRGQPTRFH